MNLPGESAAARSTNPFEAMLHELFQLLSGLHASATTAEVIASSWTDMLVFLQPIVAVNGGRHQAAELIVGIAYLAMPLFFTVLVWRRRLQLPLVFWLFLAFLFVEGFGHIVQMFAFVPVLTWVVAGAKILAAILALATLFVGITSIPRLLRSRDLKQITEALRSEQVQRRKAQSERDQFFMTSLDMMCIADLDGYFLEINPRWSQLLGYSHEELTSQPYLNFVHPDDRESTLAAAAALKEGKDVVTFENRYTCKDGSIRWLTWNATPDFDHGVVYAVARDRTARKLAEQKLAESEERLQMALEASGMCTWAWSQGRDELSWDNDIPALFGLPSGEFAGTHRELVDMIEPDDRPRVVEDAKRALELAAEPKRQTPEFDTEFRIRRADGAVRHLAARGKVYRDQDDNPARMVGLCWDITDRKETEVQLKQLNQSLEQRVEERTVELTQLNDQLQRRNKELQEFTSIAAHDLNEPLRKVQAFADRLHVRCGESLDERGGEYLQRMIHACKRMQQLIDDLLAYTRVMSRPNPFEPVDLGELAREVAANLKDLIEETGGSVDIGPLPTIEADRIQMGQLFENLISNALKFRRPDTSPSVKVYAKLSKDADDAASTDPPTQGDEARICVEDNGIGIEPKHGERIFGLFQRLHGRDRYEGTGLGLAVCRRIVERHGGAISVASKPEEGSIFTVYLPSRQPSAHMPQDATA